jgi:hypothetical protein
MTGDMTPEEARRALDTAQARRKSSAERYKWPLWADLTGAACAASVVASPALPSLLLAPVVLVLVVIFLFALRHHHARVSPQGHGFGEIGTVQIVMVCGFVALYAASLVSVKTGGPDWAPFAAALIVFAGSVLTNRIWLARWRARAGRLSGE